MTLRGAKKLCVGDRVVEKITQKKFKVKGISFERIFPYNRKEYRGQHGVFIDCQSLNNRDYTIFHHSEVKKI